MRLAQQQVDHSTASLADEMIVLAGLGIESASLYVQKEGADLTLVDETVEVAINGGETDPRQFFVNPLVDLMGERVSVIALESFEHLLQLACRTFAGGPPSATGRSEFPREARLRRHDAHLDGPWDVSGLCRSTDLEVPAPGGAKAAKDRCARQDLRRQGRSPPGQKDRVR